MMYILPTFFLNIRGVYAVNLIQYIYEFCWIGKIPAAYKISKSEYLWLKKGPKSIYPTTII